MTKEELLEQLQLATQFTKAQAREVDALCEQADALREQIDVLCKQIEVLANKEHQK